MDYPPHRRRTDPMVWIIIGSVLASVVILIWIAWSV
jgi:hypothetical protein